jgi:ABC-type nitrate/sulfonate/bicarbonate transport system substrate-binding protein
MNTPPLLRRLVPVAALGVLALGLSAPPAAGQALARMVIATGVDPAFSQFYVAHAAGIFKKNGVDVQVNTGPSGSAMVAFLVGNQVNAAYGAEQAGITAHNIDPNVVVVAEGTTLLRWESIVGSKNVQSLDDLKGKKLGIAPGTGSEVFWLEVVKHLRLNPADYTIVNVEAPEMVAALERGNIDAFSAWEPWPTRAIMSIKGAKIIRDSQGIYTGRNFIYMNRGWIETNRDTAERFMKSMAEANDLVNHHRDEAIQMVSKFLKMPEALTRELMPKVAFPLTLTNDSLGNIRLAMDQLLKMGKLKKPLDLTEYVYPDLLRKVRPANVTYTLPK